MEENLSNTTITMDIFVDKLNVNIFTNFIKLHVRNIVENLIILAILVT